MEQSKHKGTKTNNYTNLNFPIKPWTSKGTTDVYDLYLRHHQREKKENTLNNRDSTTLSRSEPRFQISIKVFKTDSLTRYLPDFETEPDFKINLKYYN